MLHDIDYPLAMLTGFLGSGHCMGMCGALISAFFMKSNRRGVLPYLTYHAARITVYTLIGIATASIGYALIATGLIGKIQGFMQLTIGLAVILLALGILGIAPWQFSMKLLPRAWIHRVFAFAAQRGSVTGAALGGFLNGMMPCPLTFAMAVNAASAPTPWHGGLMMLALGVGTLPATLFVTFAFGKVGAKARGLMLKTAALVMIGMGINTFYKGLTFLSQQADFTSHVMSVTHQTHH